MAVNGRSRPLDKAGSQVIGEDDGLTVPRQLGRRREAARGADPWTADQ